MPSTPPITHDPRLTDDPPLTDDEVSQRARRLAAAIEPIAGQVYFSPEAHAEYEALGFGASPATTGEGVHLPDGPAYFTSRGSALGQVPGELVAAAFAVFNPAVVVPLVAHGWSLTDAPTIAAARRRGGVAQLARILGPAPDGVDTTAELLARAAAPLRPEGRPLFAGVLSLDTPDDPLARVFHLTDLLREYRGDSHTAAWISAGFDATEIGLLTELYWGVPLKSYIRTRAWSSDELTAAEERLQSRGLLDGASFTEEGREAREGVERHTDRQCRPIIEALGDSFDDLLAVLEPWGADVRAAHGYLPTGPHDLASQAH